MVKLTKYEKKMYQVFSLIMGYAIGANITTMKQISIYVADTTDKIDVATDCSIGFNEDKKCYELSINDGRKIYFSKNSNEFGYKVVCDDDNMSMNILVSERISGNLRSTSVYSEIILKDEGMYVVGFRPKDIGDDTLKFAYINYYTADEIEWVNEIARYEVKDNFDFIAKQNNIYPYSLENSFEVLPNNNNPFDCFSGTISGAVERIHLLYDNVKVIKNNTYIKKYEKNE